MQITENEFTEQQSQLSPYITEITAAIEIQSNINANFASSFTFRFTSSLTKPQYTLHIKLNPHTPLNSRNYPIYFVFIFNPSYPSMEPIVLCKSHFSYPSLFDNRNFCNSLLKKWTPSLPHHSLIIEMITNIPHFITKLEQDKQHKLFYEDGEYNLNYEYNVNDFILNNSNYLFKITTDDSFKFETTTALYLVLTDCHFIILKPSDDKEKAAPRNRARIYYLGNISDVIGIVKQQFTCEEDGERNKEVKKVKFAFRMKEQTKQKFNYVLTMEQEEYEFAYVLIMQRVRKFNSCFKLVFPNEAFDVMNENCFNNYKEIIKLREKDIQCEEKAFYVVKNLMELYQRMMELYSLKDENEYMVYLNKFQNAVAKFST
jgi:ubiquitin-protein ligase